MKDEIKAKESCLQTKGQKRENLKRGKETEEETQTSRKAQFQATPNQVLKFSKITHPTSS